MIGVDKIYVEDLLKKFDIDLDLPIFILTRKFYDVYTKCKIKHDLEGFDYYYELTSKDKKRTIILTPNVEGGYLFSFFSPRRGAPICGQKYGYAGGIRDIN